MDKKKIPTPMRSPRERDRESVASSVRQGMGSRGLKTDTAPPKRREERVLNRFAGGEPPEPYPIGNATDYMFGRPLRTAERMLRNFGGAAFGEPTRYEEPDIRPDPTHELRVTEMDRKMEQLDEQNKQHLNRLYEQWGRALPRDRRRSESGADITPQAGRDVYENARYTYDAITAGGLGDPQARALVYQALDESGFYLGAHNSARENSYGWWQFKFPKGKGSSGGEGARQGLDPEKLQTDRDYNIKAALRMVKEHPIYGAKFQSAKTLDEAMQYLTYIIAPGDNWVKDAQGDSIRRKTNEEFLTDLKPVARRRAANAETREASLGRGLGAVGQYEQARTQLGSERATRQQQSLDEMGQRRTANVTEQTRQYEAQPSVRLGRAANVAGTFAGNIAGAVDRTREPRQGAAVAQPGRSAAQGILGALESIWGTSSPTKLAQPPTQGSRVVTPIMENQRPQATVSPIAQAPQRAGIAATSGRQGGDMWRQNRTPDLSFSTPQLPQIQPRAPEITPTSFGNEQNIYTPYDAQKPISATNKPIQDTNLIGYPGKGPKPAEDWPGLGRIYFDDQGLAYYEDSANPVTLEDGGHATRADLEAMGAIPNEYDLPYRNQADPEDQKPPPTPSTPEFPHPAIPPAMPVRKPSRLSAFGGPPEMARQSSYRSNLDRYRVT